MNTRSLFAGLALAGASLLPLAAWAGPPPWAGVTHGSRYHYVYYPAYEIYFAPATRYWYWREGAYWRHAYHLPGSYARITLDGFHITLGSSRPYHHHHEVARYYPAPRPYPGHSHHAPARPRWSDDDARRPHRWEDRPARAPDGGPGHFRGPGHFEPRGQGAPRHEQRGDSRHHERRDAGRRQGPRDGR